MRMNRYNASTGLREHLPEDGTHGQGGQSPPRWSASLPSSSKGRRPVEDEKPPRREPRRGGNGMDLSMLLRRLTSRQLEQEDLLLGLILYLLWRESGDAELLIALGAFLLL